jgi:hypothetical protein
VSISEFTAFNLRQLLAKLYRKLIVIWAKDQHNRKSDGKEPESPFTNQQEVYSRLTRKGD